jgi:hypothetical protein
MQASPHESSTGKNVRRIVYVLLVLGVLFVFFITTQLRYLGGNDREYSARLYCQNIQKACKAYRHNTGSFPKQLTDLIDMGNRPYLDGGERAIIDPWGKPFQFEIVKDPNGTGDEFPVVFTTNPQGRKIAWPREYGDR